MVVVAFLGLFRIYGSISIRLFLGHDLRGILEAHTVGRAIQATAIVTAGVRSGPAAASANVALSAEVNPTRLLVVSGFWPTSENEISGIFVVQQIGALVRAGCRLTVVVPTAFLRRRGNICTPAQLGLDNSRVDFIESPSIRFPEKLGIVAGVPAINMFNCGVMLRRVLRFHRGANRFDACIVHGLRDAGLSLPIWRKYVRGNVVIVVHGVDPFLAESRNVVRFRGLVNRAAAASDAVVLVGRPLQAHASFLGLPPEKLHVVPNGTDLPLKALVTFRQRSTAERRRVVSVSNLVQLKGIDDNLRALAAVAQQRPELDWEYRVIGDGPHRHELEALATRIGIAGRVSFVGRIGYEATMEEIARCDVFSLPSWGDAFGIVYLEAMARGRAVIGCHDKGAAEIISDDVDGVLVPPREVTALANALAKLLCNPEYCGRLGVAGRATAEQFSWDENARRMLALLNARSTAGG